MTSYSELENATANQTISENNLQQNIVSENGQIISVAGSPNMFQHVVDAGEHTSALMVPVTFENCRISLPTALNMPPRFLPEIDHSTGYNLPCLLTPQGHPLSIRHPVTAEAGYVLPPHVVSDNGSQGIEGSLLLNSSLNHPIIQDFQQSLIASRVQPTTVQLPLSSENLCSYRLPNLVNENIRIGPGKKLNNAEETSEVDSRFPSRFVRLDGPGVSGLRSNAFRPNREGNKDFKNGFSDS